MTEATPQGVSAAEKEPQGPQPDLARLNKIEEMADKLEQERLDDIESLRENDPGYKVREERFKQEMAPPEEKEEGLVHKETFEIVEGEPVDDLKEEKVEAKLETEIPEKLQDDPLVDYIVMKEDEPMFKTKVDGKEVLIPLERARAQLQKEGAAEVRLQKAVEFTKQLDTRAKTLQENEQALRRRVDELERPLSEPTPDVDDEARLNQAKKVVATLISGSEDDAAKELVKALSVNRAPATTTPAINTDAIIEQAAKIAEERLVKRQENLDSRKGFEEFRKEYPDIYADETLFLIADSMTDVIVAENPDLDISQVMLEAGRRTRQKIEQWKGGKDSSPIDTAADTANRQSRKAQLTPMPRTADAKPVKEPEEKTYTPQDAVDEMRKARGQEG